MLANTTGSFKIKSISDSKYIKDIKEANIIRTANISRIANISNKQMYKEEKYIKDFIAGIFCLTFSAIFCVNKYFCFQQFFADESSLFEPRNQVPKKDQRIFQLKHPMLMQTNVSIR